MPAPAPSCFIRCFPSQDEAVAERMLKKIEGFIREAREDVEPKGGAETEQPPLELEVMYIYILSKNNILSG